MPRFVALLRGLNVGGHRVKMDTLREAFEVLGLEDPRTLIASGNVLFSASRATVATLQRRIRTQLERTLGYEVDCFIRTPDELDAVLEAAPLDRREAASETRSWNILFLHEPLAAATAQALVALRSPVDEFHVVGRELHWLCQGKISVDSVAEPALSKLLKPIPTTMRNARTVQKLVEAGRGRR